MNPLLVRLRTASRPLAPASGRVAWGRPATAAAALAAVTLLTACGVGANVAGPGGGTGGNGGGGGGGGGTGATPAFTQVSAGAAHTCALGETGFAFCWGQNGDGRLGVADTARRTSPDTVASGSVAFRQVTAGGAHTCALDANGVAYCWGSNASGQLGAGVAVTGATAPTRVLGSRSWLSITAGATHTCAIAQNGAPFCWGSGANGELGTGGTSPAFEPVAVSGLAEVLAISAGDRYTCALRSTGAASCWGRAGMLGTDGGSLVPVGVSGIATYGGLDAGGRATCAIEPSVQRAACWGEAGATGNATATGTAPARVALDVDLSAVSSGGTSACALTVSGLARCWGSNASGQLGLGDATAPAESVTPLPVAGDLVLRTISVGGAHACAITTLLQTFCWGSNAAGQLGLGTAGATPVRAPTRVP